MHTDIDPDGAGLYVSFKSPNHGQRKENNTIGSFYAIVLEVTAL